MRKTACILVLVLGLSTAPSHAAKGKCQFSLRMAAVVMTVGIATLYPAYVQFWELPRKYQDVQTKVDDFPREWEIQVLALPEQRRDKVLADWLWLYNNRWEAGGYYNGGRATGLSRMLPLASLRGQRDLLYQSQSVHPDIFHRLDWESILDSTEDTYPKQLQVVRETARLLADDLANKALRMRNSKDDIGLTHALAGLERIPASVWSDYTKAAFLELVAEIKRLRSSEYGGRVSEDSYFMAAALSDTPEIAVVEVQLNWPLQRFPKLLPRWNRSSHSSPETWADQVRKAYGKPPLDLQLLKNAYALVPGAEHNEQERMLGLWRAIKKTDERLYPELIQILRRLNSDEPDYRGLGLVRFLTNDREHQRLLFGLIKEQGFKIEKEIDLKRAQTLMPSNTKRLMLREYRVERIWETPESLHFAELVAIAAYPLKQQLETQNRTIGVNQRELKLAQDVFDEALNLSRKNK